MILEIYPHINDNGFILLALIFAFVAAVAINEFYENMKK